MPAKQIGFFGTATANSVVGAMLLGTSDNGINIKQDSGVSGNKWANVFFGGGLPKQLIMIGILLSFLGRRTGIVFGSVIALMLLIGGIYLLNNNRLGWKTTSEYYQKRTGKLVNDSARWHGDSIAYKGRIDTLNRQAEAATAYAYRYRNQRDSAISGSDALTDRLTDSQKLTAYLRALVANKTLLPYAPGNLPTADNPAVIDAGLKTANHEVIQAKTVDSLAISIGRRDAQIKRLAAGGRKTIGRVDSLARLATTKGRKGGIWPFNRRRRREEQQFGNSAAAISADAESELEKELNH